MIGEPTDFRHTAHVGSGDLTTNGSNSSVSYLFLDLFNSSVSYLLLDMFNSSVSYLSLICIYIYL